MGESRSHQSPVISHQSSVISQQSPVLPWRTPCAAVGVIIRTLDDLLVYQKALAAAHAVSAIIDRPTFAKDYRLREQLSASSSRVPALIAEGFELKTDRHFAHYL